MDSTNNHRESVSDPKEQQYPISSDTTSYVPSQSTLAEQAYQFSYIPEESTETQMEQFSGKKSQFPRTEETVTEVQFTAPSSSEAFQVPPNPYRETEPYFRDQSYILTPQEHSPGKLNLPPSNQCTQTYIHQYQYSSSSCSESWDQDDEDYNPNSQRDIFHAPNTLNQTNNPQFQEDSRENPQTSTDSRYIVVNEFESVMPNYDPSIEEEKVWYRLPFDASVSNEGIKWREMCFNNSAFDMRYVNREMLFSPYPIALQKSTKFASFVAISPKFTSTPSSKEDNARKESFTRTCHLLQKKCLTDAVGWETDLTSNVFSLNELCPATRDAVHPDFVLSQPKNTKFAWQFKGKSEEVEAITDTLNKRLTSSYRELGNTLKYAWGSIPQNVLSESEISRQKALSMFQIAENLEAIEKILSHFSKGTFTDSPAVLRSFSSDLIGLVSETSRITTPIVQQALVTFINSRKEIRRLATKDLSPKVIGVKLTNSSLFAKDALLFPKDAILTADEEATKLDGNFKGAPGSTLNDSKKRPLPDSNNFDTTKRRKTRPEHPGYSQSSSSAHYQRGSVKNISSFQNQQTDSHYNSQQSDFNQNQNYQSQNHDRYVPARQTNSGNFQNSNYPQQWKRNHGYVSNKSQSKEQKSYNQSSSSFSKRPKGQHRFQKSKNNAPNRA